MSLDLTTSVNGVAVTGLTSPTYTLTADSPPANNARQSLVTALGGTQTGVRTHSPSDPFTITVTKPNQAASYPRVSANGLKIGKTTRNKYTVLIRKGTVPLAGQPAEVSDIRVEFNVVSGAEVNDKANLAASLSLLAGWATREANNLFTMETTGSV